MMGETSSPYGRCPVADDREVVPFIVERRPKLVRCQRVLRVAWIVAERTAVLVITY